MVLKSKYQALATSARRQGEKGGGGYWGREGREKKIRQGGGWREGWGGGGGRGELRSATESDPAMTSAHQQSSPASWSQG